MFIATIMSGVAFFSATQPALTVACCSIGLSRVCDDQDNNGRAAG